MPVRSAGHVDDTSDEVNYGLLAVVDLLAEQKLAVGGHRDDPMAIPTWVDADEAGWEHAPSSQHDDFRLPRLALTANGI